MDGRSWDINDPFTQLQVAATSCFFGEPQYYIDGDTPRRSRGGYSSVSTRTRLTDAERDWLIKTLGAIDPQEWRGLDARTRMERAIDAALNVDIRRTLQFAAELRGHQWNMRATPQVIMVRAAMHPDIAGTGLIGQYAQDVMHRLDDVMNQMAYFEQINGSLKRIPSRLKRAWASRLSRANEYELAKYKLTNRNINIYDAIRLTHPSSQNIDRLIDGNVSLSNAHTRTWESVRSTGGSWTEAAEQMNHMALLRNLRSLAENDALTPELLNNLKEGVERGRQLPFRYYSAYKAIEGVVSGPTLDVVEECLEISMQNAPRFAGRTMSLADNSGSAHGALTSSMGTMSVAQIGNLMSVMTGRLSDEGYVGVFGDRLETFGVRNRSSIFDQVKDANNRGSRIGHSTENGIWLFWDNAIRNREHWDNVFVYSDMQAGHGGLYGTNPHDYRDYVWGGRHGSNYFIDVPKLINTYRREVNPNVNVFLVQTAGYQDVLVPEFYDRTYILGGWSTGLLSFAARLAEMRQ
jgi:hypothetical protein